MEEQIKPKMRRRKEMIRIRAVINGIENRKTTNKTQNKNPKSWFFEKKKKSINLQLDWGEKKDTNVQYKNKKDDITADIKMNIEEYHK